LSTNHHINRAVSIGNRNSIDEDNGHRRLIIEDFVWLIC
ncbi:unnamed protein product, partial [Rotaria sp. Silwood2]